MYINEVAVLARLADLTGEDNGKEHISAVKSAIQKLKLMVKENVELNQYMSVLENIAALTAYMQVVVLENLSSPSEIKAGEVSIKNSADIKGMELLINEELRLIAPILRDNNFYFEAVGYEESN